MKQMPDSPQSAPTNHRPFFMDFIAAVALVLVAFIGGRGLARTLGAVPAIFFFVVVAGLGWYYFRVGWRELRRGREARK